MSADGPTATKTTRTRPAGPAPQRAPAGNGGSAAGLHGTILMLQRAAGNQAVSQLLQGGLSADPDATLVHAALHGSGQPLDAATQARMRAGFGRDFSRVRVHTGAGAARLTSDLAARAVTVGQEIVFGMGEYEPGTARGNLLLAHELAHTIQQSGGPAGPGQEVGSDQALEAEADRAAGAAITAGLGRGPRPTPGVTAGLRLQKKPKAPEPPSPELLFIMIVATPMNAADARDALDAYKKLPEAKRREVFKGHHSDGRIANLLRALPAADAAGPYRAEVAQLLRWIEEAETRKASGQTEEQMAEEQSKFQQAEAKKKAEAALKAKTPSGVTAPKPSTKDIEDARKEAVEQTSIPATKTTTWDKMKKSEQDAWKSRGKTVVKTVTDFAKKQHPELKITEDLFLADFGGVEKRGATVLAYGGAAAGGKTQAVFGFRFVEAAEADPAYVMSVVVHEVFGHPEYGPYGSEYHLALYDKAQAKMPGYKKPPAGSQARQSEIDAYAYQETEIYSLLRSLPYHKAIAAKDAGKNLVSIDPKSTVEARIGLMKQQWKSELARAILRGLYQRLLLDPRITGPAINAFRDGVRAHFPKKEADEILK